MGAPDTDQYSRDSSEEEEPWDQRGGGLGASSSIDSSTMRAVEVHQKMADVHKQMLMLEEEQGELPALSSEEERVTSPIMLETEEAPPPPEAASQPKTRASPARAGWLLRSGQTKRRPLQPPSLAGLTADGEPINTENGQNVASPTESEKNRRSQFWSQLDTDEEEGPDDELAARRSEDEGDSGTADLDRVMGKHFGEDDKEDTLDNRSTAEETIEYSLNGKSETTASHGGGDFCGQTLTAINEMCGGGLEQTNSTENSAPPDGKNRAISPRLPLKSDQQEEYTAIEVEFVESQHGNRSPSRSPSRNGPTTAMTAPDDEREDDAAEEEEPVQPDSTAKRTAFLSALARKAKADFDKAKVSKQKMEQHRAIENKSSGDSIDDDIYSTFTAQEKRKFLKLINSGQLPVDASRTILEARASKEAKEKAQREKKEQAASRKNQRNKRLVFWKKNRPSTANNMPQPAPNRSEDEAEVEEDPAEDGEQEVYESESEVNMEPASPRTLEPAIPAAAVSAMIAMEVRNPRPNSPPPPPPPPLEEMEEVMSPRAVESEEERFARSGINYYDAVRRDTSDTDDEVAQIGSPRVPTSSDKKKRRVRPRGFSALREGVRSKSAPRSTRIPEPVSEDEPVHFSTQSRTTDSGTVASRDSGLHAAPTNHTHDKKAQSKGSVNDGRDILDDLTEEEAVLDKNKRVTSPLRRDVNERSVSAPRNLVSEEAQKPARTPTRETSRQDGSEISSPSIRSRGLVVADVANTKKIGKDDEEMLARIEQELLSSTANPDFSPKQSSKRAIEATTAMRSAPKGRSVSTPKTRSQDKEALLGEEEKKQNDFQLSLDVDIETYMHSADVYSNAQGRETPYSDAKSVATGASGYTMSSRKRRPGAAKTRLARAKEVFQQQAAKKKGLGWHDSIQAAAENTNRVWKPGTGWVDYVDTSEQAILSPKSEEKIQMNLKQALAKNEKDELATSERGVVPVPFPKDWEKERDQMLANGVAVPKGTPNERTKSPGSAYGNIRSGTAAPVSPAMRSISSPQSSARNVTSASAAPRSLASPTLTSTASPRMSSSSSPLPNGGIDVLGAGFPTEPSPNEPLPVNVESVSSVPMRRSEKVKRIRRSFTPARGRVPQKQEKPTGWLASMQAATAALNQDGKSWDVENGWSMPDEDERRISDVVDFNVESRGVSDVVDFNGAPSPPPPPPPPRAQETEYEEAMRQLPVDVLRNSPPPSPPSSSPRGPDGKLNQWVEKSGKGVKAGTSAADISERAVASGASTEPDLDTSGRNSLAVMGVTTESRIDTSDPVLSGGVSTEPNVQGSSWSSGRVVGVSTESDARISSRSAALATGTSNESYKQSSRSVAVAGTSTEPYVQISDTGSVRAHEDSATVGRRLVGTAAISALPRVDQEEDVVNMSSESLGAFPSYADRPVSAVVDIQKIDDDDFKLFPEESREKRADRGYIASPARTPPRRKSPALGAPSSPRSTPLDSFPPAISAASSADSSRRGGGPIDTDEVDETWNSDDERRYSTGWESKSGAMSASPSHTPAKAIPKLKGSKRDTSPLRSRRLLARPGPESDVLSDISASKPEGVTSRGNQNEVMSLEGGTNEEREPRPGGPPDWPNESYHDISQRQGNPAAEWKSFMGKKVNAETAAASQQRAQGRSISGVRSEDEDSLFQFEEKKQSNLSPRELQQTDLSPIQARNLSREQYIDGEDPHGSDVYGSEGYGPTPGDGRTFLQRLTECAAPVVASAKNQVGPFVESARNSVSMSGGCVKPEVIDEEETVDMSHASGSVPDRKEKQRSKSNTIPRRGGSSVASDDFGAKTAYLEAIAMKAAVSKPRRSSSRGRGGSGSVASSAASQHSEKWKSFLERKKASGASPGKSRSSNASDVSKAAERYAAAKVEEMMAEMNANSVSSPGARRDVITRSEYSEDADDYKALQSYRSREGSRVGAAQELSAARVEAMMAQLSQSVDEAEI